MARGKDRPKGPQDGRISFRHGVQFFSKLDAAKALTLMAKAFPASRPVQTGTYRVQMHCPLPEHEDKKASFEVNTLRGYAKCHSTYCLFYTRNLLDLFARARGWTAKDALTFVQAETGLRLATEKIEKEIEALDVHHWAMRALFAACTRHLRACVAPPADDEAYSPAALRAAKPALEWLFGARKHDPELLEHLAYGLFPPFKQLDHLAEAWLGAMQTRLYEHGDATANKTLHPDRRAKIIARLQELYNGLDARWVGGVTYHMGLAPTTPGRLRIRLPRDEKDDGIFIMRGYTDDEPNGFFGLFSESFAAFGAEEDADVAWFLVEGENDATTLQERALAAGKVGVRFIASCGTANPTDLLAHAGIPQVWMIPDEPSVDYGRGDTYVRSRLESALETDVRVFNRWGQLAEGSPKDPDDAVHAHGFATCWRLFVEERAANYLTADQWAVDRAVAEAGELPEVEVRQRTAKAAEYGRCVRHPAQLARFVEEACRLLGLTAGALRAEVFNARDNEAGYIMRIAQTIRHEFHVLYKEDNARGGTLALFHKAQKRQIEFYMTDGEAMVAQFSNVFGDMYAYFKEHIGLFGVGADEMLDGARRTTVIKEAQKELREYLKFAMQEINKGVCARHECEKVGQGIHHKLDPEREGERCVYVVNGRRVYKGVWPKPGVANVAWRELDGPSEGPYLFELTPRPWSRVIDEVAALEAGNAITLAQVRAAIDAVRTLFDACWRWVHQELDATFLAWHLFASSVQCAFPSKVILSFLGPSTSGKSTAMSVFSGSQYKQIQLLEACVATSNYTMPSIYQFWDRSTLAMALEEFEDDGNGLLHKGQQVANISELLRHAIVDEGVSVRKGTADGKGREYHIHTNIVLSSILKARLGQDENRRYMIETVKVEGLKDPVVAIAELVAPEAFAALRRVATLGLLKHVPDLARLHDEVFQEVNQTQVASYAVPTRFVRNFVPLASLMKLFGEDHRAFIREACESRKENLLAAAKDTASDALFDQLTRIPGALIGENGARGSVSSLLSKADDWRLLNRSGCGVFYDDAHKVLVVDWITVTAPGGLLNRVDAFRGLTYRNLKHSLDQHRRAVKTREYGELKVFDFLRTHTINASEHELTVLRLDDFVATLRAHAQVVPPAGNGAEVHAATHNI